MSSLPYATATSGQKALDDIRKIIQAFGCSKFAPMEDFDSGEVTIQFEYRGRMVQVTASAKGYASALMREKPYSTRMRKTRTQYEKACLDQGHIAIWSMLRDWIKGQLTAIETGILSFDAAFLGQILLPDGRTVHERVEEKNILPALEGPRG
ncbi:hypothetical protein GCM10007385_35040 [Tateyamaria omphalii]|uniref:hypothetical protein n=1 Tax=Tateyamaria omphalii TaxID=299262 RepID=UPI0016767055|nr:hypothetical protein [Tateyamaria omphalii]GGX62903.1 hypothetical protein GCM10007385_35040 [Tateyamaria omphalii]